jgi:hypothetical protein
MLYRKQILAFSFDPMINYFVIENAEPKRMFVKYQVVSRSPLAHASSHNGGNPRKRLAPLKKGGIGVKVPLKKGDLGGSQYF